MTTPPLPRTLAGKLAHSHATIASLVEELQKHQQARADLEAENQRLREALKDIADLDGTEENEWDCVERVMPLMADIARTALKGTK